MHVSFSIRAHPPFMTIFIITVLIVLFFAIIIANFVKKPYVVKAQGEVAVNNTSYVASKGYAVIKEVYAKSGDYVEEGDKLLVISSGNEGIQADVIKEQIRDLEESMEVMNRYKQALMNKENTLGQSGKELEYYGKVNYYLDTLEQENFEKGTINNQVREKSKDIDKIDKEINELQSQLNQLTSNKKSNDKQRAELNNKLQSKYSAKEDTLKQIESLEIQLDSSEKTEKVQNDDLNKLHTAVEKINEEIASIENELENISKNEENILIESEIKANLNAKQSERDGLLDEVKQLEQQMEVPLSKSAELLNQLLSELGQMRNQASSKIIELTANLEAAEGQDSIHTLTASRSGVFHYPNSLAKGMSIQQNQILGEIASEEEGFYIDAYIPAQDRSRVHVGNTVKLSIIGVNNHRFGSLSGTVEFIEPGTLKNESSKEMMVFYRANVKLENTSLNSKSGEVVELIRSMPVEARIVYEEESYLDLLINLLNLKIS